MIKAVNFFNGITVSSYNIFEISNKIKKMHGIIWIDLFLENHELTHDETILLSKSFNFHEMSIEDCLFSQYYPKIEEFENYVFCAVHGIQLKPNYFQEFEDSIYELNLFIGNKFIITLHTEELFFLETLFERAKTRPQIEMKNLETILYNILNKTVSSYEFTLEKIDDKIEHLEDIILKNPDPTIMEEILYTKKIIFTMKKIAESQQTTYGYFTRGNNNNLISNEYLVYFRDIYTQCARMNQGIIMRSQMAVNLIEVYMSSITVKLTEITKFLSILATILMPILIISGYYGMNITFPEHSILGPVGSWGVAISLMFISIIAVHIYFKKKKWF